MNYQDGRAEKRTKRVYNGISYTLYRNPKNKYLIVFEILKVFKYFFQIHNT